MHLTVAICTFDRLEPLRAALVSLCACAKPDVPWELVIVDNKADAAVEAMVRSFAGRLPVRYVVEPQRGTSHARNRAVREAAGPIVLFTDDDVTFDPQWLTTMAGSIQAHSECAFWGGRVEPVFPDATGAPDWFRTDLCPMLADIIVQYRPGETPRPWRPAGDAPFYTANLALRTDAVKQAGWFDTTVGHRGSVRMGMEDSLMVKAISSAGGKGWYAADAVVCHPVPSDRLTKAYALEFARRQAALSARLAAGEAARAPGWFLKDAVSRWLAAKARRLARLCTGQSAAAFAARFDATYHASRFRAGLRRRSATQEGTPQHA